jgi:cobalt-zinc-cadmium efflux system membrane fusion protein
MNRLLLGLWLLFIAPAVFAHGGEDHGAPAAKSAPITRESGFAGEGANFQAVLVLDEKGGALIYLADIDSNAPIEKAEIEAEIGGATIKTTPTTTPGVYALAWKAGRDPIDVALVVLADGRDDLLLISNIHTLPPMAKAGNPADDVAHWTHWSGGIAIGLAMALLGYFFSRRSAKAAVILLAFYSSQVLAHGGEDHGAPATSATPPPVLGATITMPKATQFLLGIRTAKIEPKETAETTRAVGRVIPDPGFYARVQASQPARVLGDPEFPLPIPGQRVKRGQILAVLEPVISTLERGDKRAAITRLDGDIALQERDLARQTALGDIVAVKTVENIRIRLDQLRRERNQIAGTSLGRDYAVAPVDGVVTDVHIVPGEVVTSDKAMVEILDPSRLRVEAVIHDIALSGRIVGATATTRQIPDQAFALTLLGVSPRIDPLDQGSHAIFSVAPEQAPYLKLGLPLDVFLATGATKLRSAVPRDAVTDLGGRQVVFIRTAPESFEIRPIRIERGVGPFVEIDGVKAGERIVIQGIEQLKAAR